MKFRNVSIGKRIFLSNISMIIVPVLVILILTPFATRIAEKYIGSDTSDLGTFSTSDYLQWNLDVNDLIGTIKSGDFDPANPSSLVKKIEGGGTLVLLSKNGEQLYTTPGTKAAAITSEFEEITGGTLPGYDIMHSAGNGTAFLCYIDDYTLLLVNKSNAMSYSDQPSSGVLLRDYAQNTVARLGIVVLFIVAVFALSILGLTALTAAGITRPLKIIKKGTNEIANGNLDFELKYESKNEFGQLVEDFNVMRERLRESSAKQLEFEQSRREMVAGLSHDLRTPLTSIKGYVEGLRDGIAKTPEKQDEYIRTIYSATCDMENMVNDLYMFSKLETDGMVVEKEDVNIINYLKDCCEEERITLKKHDMDIVLNYTCDENTVLQLDGSKFSRVILNIISNSVKYKKPDVPGLIEIDVSKNKEYAIIKISDNGIGIDSKSLRHVFETFYRVDPSRTKTREGSGLGLAICKQIVELHGGNIWATGELGEGMAVHIAIPVDKNDKK